jgi:hypothetical protein
MDYLEITVSNDLEKLIFSEADTILGEIQYPRLLWECSCNPLDGGRSPEKGNCVLHSLDNAQKISSLFGHSTRICFHGVSIIWDGYGWPPSIDSFFLAKTALDSAELIHNTETVWDMGAGTGFLGLVLSDFIKPIKYLKAVEIDPDSASTCQFNIEAHDFNHEVNCEVINKSIFELEHNVFKPNDFIIANPPYLPLPENATYAFRHSDPVSGTDMLQHIFKLVATCQINAMICYSSLAQEEVNAGLKAYKDSISSNLLAERNCPLRLNLPTDYIEWLVQKRNLSQRDDDVFEYWHNIRVISLGGNNS